MRAARPRRTLSSTWRRRARHSGSTRRIRAIVRSELLQAPSFPLSGTERGSGIGRNCLPMPAEHAYVPDMTPLMTAQELLHTSIPNKRTELVRGRLVVREPAGYRHGAVVMNLAIRLGQHVELTGAGQLLAAETGF